MRRSPSPAEARRQDFGEATQMDDPAFGVEAFQGRDVLSLVAQAAVGGVLDDKKFMAIGKLDEPVPAFQAEGDTGWVLEVGHGVNHLGGRVHLDAHDVAPGGGEARWREAGADDDFTVSRPSL